MHVPAEADNQQQATMRCQGVGGRRRRARPARASASKTGLGPRHVARRERNPLRTAHCTVAFPATVVHALRAHACVDQDNKAVPPAPTPSVLFAPAVVESTPMREAVALLLLPSPAFLFASASVLSSNVPRPPTAPSAWLRFGPRPLSPPVAMLVTALNEASRGEGREPVTKVPPSPLPLPPSPLAIASTASITAAALAATPPAHQ